MASESKPSAPPAGSRPFQREALILIAPLAVVIGWWIFDLSYQWRSLVEYQFGWIVVMLAGYLIMERWPTLPAQDTAAPFGRCLAMAGFGFVFVIAGELYRIGLSRTPTSSMSLSIGCALFVSSLILALRGPATLRHFLFPLLFFFVAVPIPKILWNPIVFGLQSFVATLNVETLRLIGIPAEQNAHVIKLPTTTVGVNEACSGIRSLQSSLMAALFVGDLMLKRAGWKVSLVVGGVVLAVVGNFGRSLFLSITAYRAGAAGLQAVHDTAGWSVLTFTAVGVVVLVQILCRLERHALLLARDAQD
jgi:exosortase